MKSSYFVLLQRKVRAFVPNIKIFLRNFYAYHEIFSCCMDNSVRYDLQRGATPKTAAEDCSEDETNSKPAGKG